jgi:hypothetical protein
MGSNIGIIKGILAKCEIGTHKNWHKVPIGVKGIAIAIAIAVAIIVVAIVVCWLQLHCCWRQTRQMMNRSL